MAGKLHSEETRYKQRISHIKNIKQKYLIDKFVPNYSVDFCNYSDLFINKTGMYIQHARNGGEKECLGFFADGYITNKNIWIEYDEPKHYFGGKLRNKDVIRQKQIQEEMRCRFLRIKEVKSYEEFENSLLNLIQ
jgi:hypothetical protein